MMKYYFRTLFVGLMLMILTACGTGGLVKSLNNTFSGIKSDSAVMLLGTRFINEPAKVSPRAYLYYKNVNTGEEEKFAIYPRDMQVKKPKPGTYVITKWSYDACKVMYAKSRVCKEYYGFTGYSAPLGSGNRFTVKKGETIYLGEAIIDVKKKALTFGDNFGQDVAYIKSQIDLPKNRKTKNISHTIHIRNWQFIITGK